MMGADATFQVVTNYLVPSETAVETPGSGAPLDLGPLAGKPVMIVLRVTDIIEQEALQVSIWGSLDGKDWGASPLFSFPERFYRGVTPAALDLRQRPEVKFLQVRWQVNRWGRGYPLAYFKFWVEIQEWSVVSGQLSVAKDN